MEVMFHFAFELVKISLLSILYAGLVTALLKLLRPNTKVLSTWLVAVPAIWVSLFIYLFTYWGDHGLGDTALLPIGNGKVIESINALEYASILEVKNSSGNNVQMTRFVVSDGKVFGNCDDWFYEVPCAYLVYDTEEDELFEFTDSLSYLSHADRNGWPRPDAMVSFGKNYHCYWGGWRFWLLP